MLTRSSGLILFAVCFCLFGGPVRPAHALPAGFIAGVYPFPPSGIHVLDGSYVLNVGELRVNITNVGLIGSQYSGGYIYSNAASGEWPGGSGDEYLWGAGLWIGGRTGGETSVTTGQLDQELRPSDRLGDTIYEARRGIVLRPEEKTVPTGRRLPESGADDDGDGRHDEDGLNGLDDDGDGLVDEDFGQLGDQMFTCTMYDNLRLIQEMYPAHLPLGLMVEQRAMSWDREVRQNIVGLDYEITNVGHKSISDVYLGFYVDCDIQNRDGGSAQPDDLAGSFSGLARGSDDFFYRLDLGYMWDGAEDHPLPGYFGVQLLNHTTAFDGITAPFAPRITSFNIFATTASVNQDGEPLSDADRYYVMSHPTKDRNLRPDEAADLKFLISSGPFGPLEIGDSLDYQLAMVVGTGFQGMMDTAIEAARVFAGRWYDEDDRWVTGQSGRETLVCLGDYPRPPFGDDPILGHRLNFMDDSCTGGYPVMFQDIVHPENLEEGWVPDRECVWVNMDNCTECLRTMGRVCDDVDFFDFIGRYPSNRYGSRYTGVWGREKHYAWTVATATPPPAPLARVEPGDNHVEVFWDDRSEIVPDPYSDVVDFESYRIWRVNGWVPPTGMSDDTAPPIEAWGMIAEFDLVNEIPAAISGSSRDLPLGRNTGLDGIRYEPACLGDSRFTGLAAAMQGLVDSDVHRLWFERPPVRGHDGSVNPGMEPFVRWETYPDVLDTFFAVTARAENATAGIVGKPATRYYHYIDPNTHNGFKHYYAVVARDHQLTWSGDRYVPSGVGIQEDPSNNLLIAEPRTDAQTVADRETRGANIYVFPNPATREALAEFQAREPSTSDPTGVRVMFNNLPLAHNTIRIYSVAGDLLETVYHDGTGGDGSAGWNLTTRNGQEVVSGIYLYAVHSDRDRFDPFRGRFVVIR